MLIELFWLHRNPVARAWNQISSHLWKTFAVIPVTSWYCKDSALKRMNTYLKFGMGQTLLNVYYVTLIFHFNQKLRYLFWKWKSDPSKYFLIRKTSWKPLEYFYSIIFSCLLISLQEVFRHLGEQEIVMT